jgi:trimeric autotransporter adhesin
MPLPFVGPAGEGAAMPLQGTRAARTAAADTAAAAEQAGKTAGLTRATGEIASAGAAQDAADVAARGSEWTTAQRQSSAEAVAAARQDAAAAQQQAADAQQRATAAQQRAADAAAKLEPSPAAATRAQEALAPAEVTTKQGGQAADAGLEQRLKEWKDPASGIYDSYVAGHTNAAGVPGGEVLGDPTARKRIIAGVDAVEKELGTTFTGKPAEVLTQLRDRLKAGEMLTVNDANQYKTQLDAVLPGRAKMGASLRETKLYDLKAKARELLRSAATPEEKEWLEAADNIWRNQVVGRDTPLAIGNLVRLVKKTDPGVVIERLFGNGTTDKAGSVASAVMRELGDHPAAPALQQAFFGRMVGKAIRNSDGALTPKGLLDSYDKLNKTFVDAMTTPEVKTFFRVLRQEQTEAEQSAVAATSAASQARAATSQARSAAVQTRAVEGTENAATTRAERSAADAARKSTAQAKAVARTTDAESSAAERTAADAQKAADRAKAEAEAPNRIARFAARGIQISTLGVAGKALSLIGLGGRGVEGAAVGAFMPAEDLARALANSKTANLLTRALRTTGSATVRTQLVPALLQSLKDSGVTLQEGDGGAGQ